MEEIWKDIEGYEGYYQVSNLGKVRSLDREMIDVRGDRRRFKGKILKLQLGNGNGHWVAGLNKSVNYNYKTHKIYIHRLVAIHFIPNPNNHPMVCHKDDDQTNNIVDNLYWGTSKDNVRDRWNNGPGQTEEEKVKRVESCKRTRIQRFLLLLSCKRGQSLLCREGLWRPGLVEKQIRFMENVEWARIRRVHHRRWSNRNTSL